MKKLMLFFACLFASGGPLYAQGAFSPPATATKSINGLLAPAGGATITVCAAGAIGEPCSPVLTGVLFSDQALTQPLSDPFTADSSGNYQFAAAAATYTVTVTGTNIPGYSYQVQLGGAGSSSSSDITNCTTVGGVAFQNGTANTLTCGTVLTFASPNLTVKNGGTGSTTTPLTVQGSGSGSFTPNGNTSLVNFEQQSFASSNNGLVLTNRAAVGSSTKFSSIALGLTDAGNASICAGNAVGDSNGNFACFNWDSLSGVLLTGSTIAPNITKVIFSIQGTPGQTGHLLNFLNSSGTVLSYVDAAGTFSGAGALNWQRLGTVVGVPSAPGFYQESTAFIQTSPQILTGYPQVVALMFTGDSSANNVYYAEAPSPAGPFTLYSSSGPGGAPTPVLSGAGCSSNVQSLGGQLVMFACANRTDIHRYHSTTNGITWVDDGAEISHGVGWKAGYAENPYFLIVSGTCHLWFEGATTLSPPLLIGQGHATSSSSTCAHGTFTEDVGDPVIPTSEFNGGGPAIFWSGTGFYEWEHGTAGGSSDAYPTNMYVTQLNTNGSGTLSPKTHTEVFQARYADEGANQTLENTQVADPFILEWPGAPGTASNWTYLYYTACANLCAGNEQMSLKVAVIKGTQAQIVASFSTQTDTAQQVIALPQSYTTCTDYGTRANGNPGAQWAPGGGATSATANVQIASNLFETTSTTAAARVAYNGCPFGPSQSSSVTFVTGAATSVIGTSVRVSAGASGVNQYECVTAAVLGASQSMVIRKIVGGAVSATIATFTATPAVNDVWKLSATGTSPTVLTCTQNGTQPSGAAGTDASSPLTTGQPGFVLFDSSAVTNAQVKNWVGAPL